MPSIETVSERDLEKWRYIAATLLPEYSNTLEDLEKSLGKVPTFTLTLESVLAEDVKRLQTLFDRKKKEYLEPLILYNLAHIIERLEALYKKYNAIPHKSTELQVTLNKCSTLLTAWKEELEKQHAADKTEIVEYPEKQNQLVRPPIDKEVKTFVVPEALDFSGLNPDRAEELDLLDDYYGTAIPYRTNLKQLFDLIIKKYQLASQFCKDIIQIIQYELNRRHHGSALKTASGLHDLLEQFDTDFVLEKHLTLFHDQHKIIGPLLSFDSNTFDEAIKPTKAVVVSMLGFDSIAAMIAVEETRLSQLEALATSTQSTKQQVEHSGAMGKRVIPSSEMRELQTSIAKFKDLQQQNLIQLKLELARIQQFIDEKSTVSSKIPKVDILLVMKDLYENIIKKYTLALEMCTDFDLWVNNHLNPDRSNSLKVLLDRFLAHHLKKIWDHFVATWHKLMNDSSTWEDKLKNLTGHLTSPGDDVQFLYLPSELFFIRKRKICITPALTGFIIRQDKDLIKLTAAREDLQACANDPSKSVLQASADISKSTRTSIISICELPDDDYTVIGRRIEDADSPSTSTSTSPAHLRPQKQMARTPQDSVRFSVCDEGSYASFIGQYLDSPTLEIASKNSGVKKPIRYSSALPLDRDNKPTEAAKPRPHHQTLGRASADNNRRYGVVDTAPVNSEEVHPEDNTGINKNNRKKPSTPKFQGSK